MNLYIICIKNICHNLNWSRDIIKPVISKYMFKGSECFQLDN